MSFNTLDVHIFKIFSLQEMYSLLKIGFYRLAVYTRHFQQEMYRR